MSEEWKNVFIHRTTLQCAYKNHCIPCFYKIFPLHKSKSFPNQRPEMCPRSKNKHYDGKGLYSSDQMILTIGDGDFSFSLSLSYKLREDQETPINFIATSYESGETVRSVYPNAEENIEILRSKGVPVLHDVDATRLECVPLLQQEYQHRFDIIIWNFPCKRANFGADAQVNDIEENKDLLRGFFRSAQQFLKSEQSTIHVTHKTLEPFCWWNIIDIAKECGLSCEGSIVFDRYMYPGYINRKALDKKSFPFNDARTYIFTQRRERQGEGQGETGDDGGGGVSLLKEYSSLRDLGEKKQLKKLQKLKIKYSDSDPDQDQGQIRGEIRRKRREDEDSGEGTRGEQGKKRKR